MSPITHHYSLFQCFQSLFISQGCFLKWTAFSNYSNLAYCLVLWLFWGVFCLSSVWEHVCKRLPLWQDTCTNSSEDLHQVQPAAYSLTDHIAVIWSCCAAPHTRSLHLPQSVHRSTLGFVWHYLPIYQCSLESYSHLTSFSDQISSKRTTKVYVLFILFQWS